MSTRSRCSDKWYPRSIGKSYSRLLALAAPDGGGGGGNDLRGSGDAGFRSTSSVSDSLSELTVSKERFFVTSSQDLTKKNSPRRGIEPRSPA
ncbi:unnamed protein product [Trichogramma brassicae]|uniref:Uncharacterized protein n=1 Tax=Trichogramma brassicae TaxID=86971 RepID=A0A6H5HRW6_9HYME|nr:unnamed protein product [Trichogramma brassicae]